MGIRGIPVIILTKSDLVENIQDYINQVENIAFGVDIYAVSCITQEGLEDIKKYFSKGNTIVFLGSSGVGKLILVNTLYGEEVMKKGELQKDRFEQYLKLKKESSYNTDSNQYLKEKKINLKKFQKLINIIKLNNLIRLKG